MSKTTLRFKSLSLGAALAVFAFAYELGAFASEPEAAQTQPTKAAVNWVAAAPGRIEPKGGEVRLSVLTAGAVREVLVAVNARVKAGDLLLKLDDDELATKLAVAKTQSALRLRERDLEDARGLALDQRKAEDAVFNAREAVFQTRLALDHTCVLAAKGKAESAALEKAHADLAAAKERLEKEEASLASLKENEKLPAQTRAEAALGAARADMALIEIALEKMRLRAPIDGTVLQLNAKAGESVSPLSESALIVLGNTEALQVKSEVSEQDAAKITVGQTAIVKADAIPAREFSAEVTSIAPKLAPPQIGKPSQIKPADVNVLEVALALKGGEGLLPGMRADVYFLPPGLKSATAEAKSN